jgi:hypothetical protein
VLKFVPETLFPMLGDEPEDEVQAAKDDYTALLANAKRYGKFRDNSNSQRFI